MNLVSRQIVCAYLYPITLYGYPPDITSTNHYISEMAAMGFRSVELEGIGAENIMYLFDHQEEIGNALVKHNCKLPILCLVLPELSSADASKRRRSLEIFEMGCKIAKRLGAKGVLDNGPLLPFEYPADAPILRHYTDELLSQLKLPTGFEWAVYHQDLIDTYRRACDIASAYGLLYHLHPCEGSLITTADSFINFANAVGRANLFFNMDTANQFFFRDELSLSVLRLAEKISYIHISDSRGTKVEHLAPGDGKIRWESFFAALSKIGYKGDFGIDVGGAESDIENLKEAYLESASWLQNKLEKYSLTKK